LVDAPIFLLTPNASEAAALSGADDPSEAARVLSDRTGAAVLITLGADGALLLEPGGSPVRLPATAVEVVDTTGAGDTVNGALAAELAEGRSLADAARFALRAAALSTTAPGARGGMPRRAEVDA
jgi:ribokinase